MKDVVITVSKNEEKFVRCNICLEKEDLHDIDFTFYNRTVLLRFCTKHLVELESKINDHLR